MSASSQQAYRISVDGCDDSTRITRALTPEQAAFLREIAAAITAASKYGCMPTMEIEAEPQQKEPTNG